MFPLIARLLPMLLGVGESGGLSTVVRSLAGGGDSNSDGGQIGGLKDAIKDLAVRVVPRDVMDAVIPRQKSASERKPPATADVAEEGVARARRFTFGAPINPDSGKDVSNGLGRIRFAERVAEAQGRGGYRIAGFSRQPNQQQPGNAPTTQQPASRAGLNPAIAQQVATGAFNVPGAQTPTRPAQQATGYLAKFGRSVASAGQWMAKTLAAATKWTTWVVTATLALRKFAGLIVESNSGLSLWNGAIANSFAELDARQQQRDLEQANATAGTTVTLNRLFGDLQEEFQPIRESLGSVANLLGIGVTQLARVGTILVKFGSILGPLGPILDKIEKALNKEQQNANDQLEEFRKRALGAGFPIPPAPPPAPAIPPKPRLPPMMPPPGGRP